MYWTHWIAKQWPLLSRGRHVIAPAWLPHPAHVGFTRVALATPSGQVADWSLAYDDGSRVHIHEYADGRMVVHRDCLDPDRSIGGLVNHLLGETLVGPVLLGVLVIAAIRAAR